MTKTQTAVRKPGRPKKSEADRPKSLTDLTQFNCNLQENTKRDLEAILALTDYNSYREVIEDWAKSYLEENPAVAKKVKAHRKLLGV